MIPVTRPDVGDEELDAVGDALETGWIGLGPKVGEFEDAFRGRFGYGHAIATNSCTNALDLAIKSSDLTGSEILVPPITWVSTAHVARYNDYEVGWVDVDPETLCMDPESLTERISDDTAAVIPVHYGGQPAEIESIVDIAHEHDALVIEDCAHAPGARYEETPVGAIGDVGCFSFQATKPLTTGEGGMLVTDDEQLATRARRKSKLGVDKSTHERSEEEGYSWYYEVTDVGYKYFMHDISAGIGLVQLDRLPETRSRRREIATVYKEDFEQLDWITPLTDKSHVTSAWYNYTVLVPPKDREALIEHLDDHNVGATVHYMPLYKHPVFEGHNPDLKATESTWERIVTLPMASTFSPSEVSTVVDAVRSFRD
ncbi:DegT/DnrJ/EryC1/StrS family aminotransferase [Haloarcula sp. GH36]|uniref:DegT/DnrJ/EryC1/StrS family aminotransferase n=1 Tax=Haloarcula montana TaxID=3111776 RepID=UPI002D773C46|nr:DegT/DnrJ/EryC1/StrS aminotransferase family protein [Haloarcula sp. GH36]